MFGNRFKPNSIEYRLHVQRLRRCCELCPVMTECRDFMDVHEDAEAFGGGETPTERLRRRLPDREHGRETAAAVQAPSPSGPTMGPDGKLRGRCVR